MAFETSFIANREVRRVPKGWQHPKDERGKYVPLLDRRYWDELARELGADSLLIGKPMPEVEHGDEYEIAAYETTTEGTPISPAFPDTDEGQLALVNYCAENATTYGTHHRASPEAWAAILFGGGVMVGSDGRVFR
jgi:hypothetical protein